MTTQMWLENLAAYSLQVALLVVAGTALVYAFRLKAPAVLLAFWQILLAICLLLPVVQPWRRPAQSAPPPLVIFDTSQAVLPVLQPVLPVLRSSPLSTYAAVAAVLAAGVVLRFLWLGIGLFRLSRYRSKARRPAAFPETILEMQWRVGASPEILFSPEINTPVGAVVETPFGGASGLAYLVCDRGRRNCHGRENERRSGNSGN